MSRGFTAAETRGFGRDAEEHFLARRLFERN
jgi:hypothetical protein